MMSAQGFLSTRSLEPTTVARGKLTVDSSLPRAESLSVLLQTGLRHQARGPNASTKVELANDRPSPRSVLIQTSTQLVTARDERSSGWLPTADDDSWQRQGHSHSKPKNLFPCYLSIGQLLCWEEPRKIPR